MQASTVKILCKTLGVYEPGACLEAPPEIAGQQAFARTGRALPQIGCCGLRQPAALPELPGPAKHKLSESMLSRKSWNRA